MGLLRDGTSAHHTKRPIDMLISTKLDIPPLNERMISREHLIDQLSAGKDRRLILITGMAGSGKTCLVCQWIKHDKISAAWYSLDPTDNEEDLFFRYVLASFAKKDDRLAETFNLFLQGRKKLSHEETCHFLVESMATLVGHTYLVLDDYHHITLKEIHDALSYLLRYMPPNLHIILINRHQPPLSLGRLRVRDQVVEISAEKLGFTQKETEQYFAEVIPVKLSVDEVRELARYMEGWVSGLRLLALVLTTEEENGNLTEALIKVSREVTEYLAREVIDVQPPRVKAFLEATALLERFNVEVCAEIAGVQDAGDLLDFIYRNNLFLVPINAEGTWYRYHHLFSEAVRQRLQVSSPDLQATIHRKAALWFVQNGFLKDAFQNAFVSEDFEFVVDLIEDYLLYIHRRFEYATGLRSLAKLPDETFMEKTVLRLHECGQRMESFQFDDIEAAIEDIENSPGYPFKRFKGFKKMLGVDLLTYFRYALRYFYRDPLHADVDRLNEALEKISPENRVFFSVCIKILIAISYLIRGHPSLAETVLQEASSLIFSSGNPWARIHWFRLAAGVELAKGHLNRSEAILQEAFGFLEQRGLSDTPLNIILYPPMAWVLYHRNDLEKAREYAAGAALHGEHVKLANNVIEGNLLLSLISMAEGKPAEAKHHLHQMLRVSKKFDASDGRPSSQDPWAIRISIMQGDIEKSALWAEERRLSMDEPFSARFSLECLALAELLFQRGSYQDALLVLNQLRDLCVERQMMETVFEIDLLRSGTLYAIGDREQAVAVMEEVLSFAHKEGYVRPFINYAPAISPVLRNMADHSAPNSPSAPLAAILSVIPNGAVTRKPAGETGNRGLTVREIQLLELMAGGDRYKEIAKKIYLSVQTVKTHAKNIFKKLNVNTRIQAIRRAEALGLLTNRLAGQ